MTCTSACRLGRVMAIMAVNYCLIVLNMRFVATRHFSGTIATDAVIAFTNLVLIKFAVQATSSLEKAAYIAGACAGSALALWIT